MFFFLIYLTLHLVIQFINICFCNVQPYIYYTLLFKLGNLLDSYLISVVPQFLFGLTVTYNNLISTVYSRYIPIYQCTLKASNNKYIL